MSENKRILTLVVSVLFAANVAFGNAYAQQAKTVPNTAKPVTAAVQTTSAEPAKVVNPLDLVVNPGSYLNDRIKITTIFDKFSTLGLDYKPAMRDSKKYISFLTRRPDVTDNHTIPLSELKLIIKRDKAEKLINMESGDKIEITGKVFSSALGDPWVDVDNVTILTPKTKAADAKKTAEKSPANPVK